MFWTPDTMVQHTDAHAHKHTLYNHYHQVGHHLSLFNIFHSGQALFNLNVIIEQGFIGNPHSVFLFRWMDTEWTVGWCTHIHLLTMNACEIVWRLRFEMRQYLFFREYSAVNSGQQKHYCSNSIKFWLFYFQHKFNHSILSSLSLCTATHFILTVSTWRSLKCQKRVSDCWID